MCVVDAPGIGIEGHYLDPYREKATFACLCRADCSGAEKRLIPGTDNSRIPVYYDGSVPKNTGLFKPMVFPGAPGWLSR